MNRARVNEVVTRLNNSKQYAGKNRWSAKRLLSSFNISTDAHLRATEELLWPTSAGQAARRVSTAEAAKRDNIAAL